MADEKLSGNRAFAEAYINTARAVNKPKSGHKNMAAMVSGDRAPLSGSELVLVKRLGS
jgi:hypothetical protein